MSLDFTSLERAIVRHCSPTLTGIKPGCLFNIPITAIQCLTNKPSKRVPSPYLANRQRSQLLALVNKAEATLKPCGISIRILAYRGCGALIYVYRQELLKQVLLDPLCASQLKSQGYVFDGADPLEDTLTHLSYILDDITNRSRQTDFPHEIGFFLGYPYDDVMGFIEHHGRNYLCCGCWKVYTNRPNAEARFSLYKHCTYICEQLLERGVSLQEIGKIHICEAA